MKAENKDARPWFYAYDRDAEMWNGPCATRDEALAEASPAPGQSVWLDQGDEVLLADIFRAPCLDIDGVLEALRDYVYDNVDEDAADRVEIGDMVTAQRELLAWAERHVRFDTWWRMSGNSEEVTT